MSAPKLVELPAEAEMGPAMRALPNDRWRRFVLACNQPTSTGQVNYTQAAADSGFATENRESLAVSGHRLAHDERIQAAMLEESKRRLKGALPMATAAIIKILADPLSKRAEIMKAATILMDRGGMPMATEHKVDVTRTKDYAEQVEDAIRLCKELGIDPAQALGNIGITMPGLPAPVQHAGQVVDAEFEVVGTTEGLEDFL